MNVPARVKDRSFRQLGQQRELAILPSLQYCLVYGKGDDTIR